MEENLPAQEIVFRLIRRGMGLSCPDPVPPLSSTQWEEVLLCARKQAVLGVVYAGLDSLGTGYPIPSKALFTLVGQVDRLERKGQKLEALSAALLERLSREGWHPVLMKGPQVARFYPRPLLRESGDIDLYLPPAEWKAFVESHPQLGTAPDGSLQWEEEGVPVDLHSHYFDLHHVRAGSLPPVPSPEATLVMLSAHILKHCMTAGIGLKQLCDMALAYEKCEYRREDLLGYYRKTGTLDWNRLLASFLVKYLKISHIPFSPAELPSARPLEKIVFPGGNLGQYFQGRQENLLGDSGQRKRDTARRILRRMPFSLRYAPREWFHYISLLAQNNCRTARL